MDKEKAQTKMWPAESSPHSRYSIGYKNLYLYMIFMGLSPSSEDPLSKYRYAQMQKLRGLRHSMSILYNAQMDPKWPTVMRQKKITSMSKIREVRLGGRTHTGDKTAHSQKKVTLTKKRVRNIVPGLRPFNNPPCAVICHYGPQAWNPCGHHKLADWRPTIPYIFSVCSNDITPYYLLDCVLDWVQAGT